MSIKHVLVGVMVVHGKVQRSVAIYVDFILNIFVIACQDKYAPICVLKSYDKVHEKSSESVSTVDG